MLQFVCDYCENVKLPGETWLAGMAAENVGTKAARREVVIDPTWRRDRAVQPFAVHFCSIECKDRYLSKLFQKPAALLEIQEVDVVPEAAGRVIHARKKPVTSRVTKTKVTTSRRVGKR
jgi:hypothetical protein